MSGPPPADPAAVSGEGGEGDKGEGGEEREEGEGHEQAALSLGDLIVAPAYADEGGEGGEELFEEMHEIAVNLLYVLIALHLAGVIFETRRSGREIVGAMIPGGNRRG
jgi:cytochrome b